MTLKGEDGVSDLSKGKDVQLLGFTLSKPDHHMVYGLGKEALNHLAHHLGQTHETDNPTKDAKASLFAWVQSLGPAFANGVTEVSKILSIAADQGFRELASPRELEWQWKKSWIRWQKTRERVYRHQQG